jgi:3-oxoacyl-[acyl-carrier protein] reductase
MSDASEPHGRVALVTGSSRGLGRATALELARRGHVVAVHYVRGAEAAEETVRAIEAAGGRAAAFGADVADAAACTRLLAEAQERLGRIEVLVNNAGITRDTLTMRMRDDDWQAVLDTNLSGAFRLARGVLRGMLKARWGRIVNVSSVVALIGNTGQANYVAAKAGLIGLTRSLAREVSSRGVTVNAVAPGFIASDMTEDLSEELRERYLTQIPAGRFGRPEDVARAVAFLVSEDAAYVTGHTLTVDGGMAMQ